MLAGYALIVCLTTFGFSVVLGGRVLYGGSLLLLGAAVMVAVVSGLAGGYLAGWIGPARGSVNAALVLILLAVDTTYVLFFWHGASPFWFDAMGSATLMICTILGGVLCERSGGRTAIAA
jgi:hypothetical protein